jgi:hypothetical protein
MKKIFIGLILITNLASGQTNSNIIGLALTNAVINSLNEPVSTSNLYRYINFNGFNYDYSSSDLNLYVHKYFKITKISELTVEKYRELNINIFNSDYFDGQMNYIDTFYFPSNINFKDANFLVSDILSNNYFREFNTNKYGLYFIDVRNSFYFLSDLVYKLKINVYKDYMTLTANQILILPIKPSYNFNESKKVGPYNSHDLGFIEFEKLNYEGWYDNKGTVSMSYEFDDNMAYNHLIYLSSLLETRSKLKKYFNDYLFEISKAKSNK